MQIIRSQLTVMNISINEQVDHRGNEAHPSSTNKIIGWTLVLWLHCHSAAYVAVVVGAAVAAEAEAGVHGDS